MVTAIVVTHGKLAEELLSTAKTIFGECSRCRALSNNNKTTPALTQEIRDIVEAGAEGEAFLILVDFFGGSCCHAALPIEHEYENVKLIAGVNLPMVLAFLYKKDEVSFDALPGELLDRGHGSIRIVDAEEL